MTSPDEAAVPGSAPRPAGVAGYAPGAYDLFHVGHLNLLRRARLSCDYLIAGVVCDEVALQQKGRWPVVPEEERLAVVAAMDVVDEAVMELTTDKMLTWQSVRFDVVFKGDDWRGSAKWTALEAAFATVGVRVEYLPYTELRSTTKLRPAARAAMGGG